jgi:uncharacterized protein
VETVLIKGAHGGRINVKKGELLQVEAVTGHQVCDFFAFNLANIREALSPAHMRSVMRRIRIKPGDKFWSNLRNPMFELIEDTVGVHDFSVPACDPKRYSMDFDIAQHRSCRDNLSEVMADHKIPYEYLPDPVNLFQPTNIELDGRIVSGTSPVKPGDKVVLLALMDLIAVGSACPQDQTPLNNFKPSDIRFTVRNA